MRSQKFLILSLVVVSFFVFSGTVFAFTIIDTDILENITWTQNQSPYVVRVPTLVASQATLTIEPGVIVKFDYGASLFVNGTLNAEGTNLKPIYFTSNYDDEIGGNTDDETFCYEDIDEEGNVLGEICETYDLGDPFVGDWNGIYFSDSIGSSLKNVYSQYADYTFEFFSSNVSFENIDIINSYSGFSIYSGNVVFDHISLNNISGDAFSVYDGVVEIKNSTIENVGFGDALGFYNGSLHVSGLAVKNIGFGSAFGIYGGSAVIENSTFEKGLDAGIEIYGGLFNMHDSLLSGYSSGNLVFYGGVSTLSRLKIENTNYGVSVYDGMITLSESTFKEIFVNAVESYSANQIDARQNFWGDSSGPYEADRNPLALGYVIYGDVLFDPWLTSDPFEKPICCSNVLFLPGLEASRLYLDENASENQLWEPNRNLDVEKLYLNDDGSSKNADIYTRDIIKETNTPIPTGSAGQNIYKSFVDMLNNLVDDSKINVWKPFAYDWRQDVQDIVENGTKYQNENVLLVSTLESLIESSKNSKVTIVAHSNGGLLAKALLKKLQDDKTAGINNLIDNIDVLILVAVPEIGTAKTVPAILHGYDQNMLGGWLMDETRARELGRNMLGAFGLLPSKEYINHVSASPTTFVDTAIPSNVTTKLVQVFGSAINSYSEYKDFLFGNEGRTNPNINQTRLPINLSESLFAKAGDLHDSIDAWIPPASMRVIEVAGWGLDTVASFEYYPKLDCGGSTCISVLDQRPRFTSDGDKTVIVPSAQYMSFQGNAEKYWVDLPRYNRLLNFTRDREHKDILEVDSLNNLIKSVLNQEEIILDDILKNFVPIDDSNRLRLSIHSPVTLDAYDAEGNHTGKICPSDSDFCYVEENILNSSYLEFGEGKYINLPEDQMLKIKLQGTDIGTFTYESEKVLPNGTSTVSSFVDIPVTTQTQAEITLNPSTQVPQLVLDVTGDGLADFTLTPNANFDPITYLKIMKATINSLDIPQARIKAFNNRVDNIIKLIQKGKINKAELKAEKFKKVLEKKLTKPDPKKPRPKKLSKTDAQLLLDMLNKLLDNIN